jgi:hypothetical protein
VEQKGEQNPLLKKVEQKGEQNPLLKKVEQKCEQKDENITPLKIYNETPEGRPNRDLRATLPINELKGKPPTEVCPILNLHRCKQVLYIILTIINIKYHQNAQIHFQKKWENPRNKKK